MNRSTLIFAVAALSALGHAELLGLSSNAFSNADFGGLHTLNTGTGAATRYADVNSAGALIPTSIVGFAYLDGSLYASDVFGPSSVFGTIDRGTGAFHDLDVDLPGGAINLWSLAADPTAHVLYSTDGGGSDDPTAANYSPYRGDLLRIDPVAGTTTDLGKTRLNGNNTFMDGMAFDSSNGKLYGWNGSDLYSIDTTTAVVTFVGNSGGVSVDNGGDMTYDASTGTMFVIESDTLYTLDVATATLTVVGADGSSQLIDGLAVAPVPEPSALAALGLGVLGLLHRRARR